MGQPINTKEYWQGHIQAQEVSGLSKAEYCRQNKIRVNRFLYWYHKLKAASTGEMIPVKVQASEINNGQSYGTLEYPNGIRLKIESKELLMLLPRLVYS